MLIVSSSGTWNRVATDLAVNLSPDDLMASRLHIFLEKMWRFIIPLLALAIGVALLVMRRGKVIRKTVWTYVLLSLAIVMFALGQIHERSYAPMVTVAWIIVMMALDSLLTPRWKNLRLVAVAVAMGLSIFTFARGIKVMNQYKAFNDQVEQEIATSPNQAILPQRQFDGYSRFIKPMNYMSTNFFAHEVVYRAYYGKENVQFVSDSVYLRYHEGRLLDCAQALNVKCDRSNVVDSVYTFADQDYIAVLLKGNSLPSTFQTARYYTAADSTSTLDAKEIERRKQYGINIDYEPHGFYPIEYQGRCYLISSRPSDQVGKMVFPMALPPDPKEITLEIQK